jgi:hypothetical protein
MKMNLLRRYLMGLRFRLGQGIKNSQRPRPRLPAYGKTIKNIHYIGGMPERLFIIPVYLNPAPGTAGAILRSDFNTAVNTGSGQDISETAYVDPQMIESRQGHVTADAARAI